MKPKTYMPALTGIRAIAAYLVFFHHNNRGLFPASVNRLFWELHIGVNIFFVLSGFLIYYRYFSNVELHRQWLGQYFINRVARIYPVYFILTIVTFCFGDIIAKTTPFMYGNYANHFKLFLLNITFLKGFFYYLNFTGIAQSWTLTVEECFYLLAPLLFIIIKKDKKALIWLPVIITIAGLGLVALLGDYRDRTHGLYGNNIFMFLFTFNGTCCEFFIGMALANIILKSDNTPRKKPYFTFAGIFIMLLSLAILCSFKQTDAIITGAYHPLGTLTDHLLLPIGISALFYGLIKEKSFVRRFLSTRLMELLGKSSYAFYLIHVGIISVLIGPYVEKIINSILADHAVFGEVVRIAIMFVILNVIAIIIFKAIEEPLNNSIKSYFKRRTGKHKKITGIAILHKG